MRAILATLMLLGLLAGCRPGGEPPQWPVTGQEPPDWTTQAAGLAASQPATRPAQATAIGEDSTLADYLTYAALNSPSLKAAYNRWQAAVERVPQAQSLSDPQFSYRYFIQEQMMADGLLRHVFELQQNFPFFGKLDLRGQMAAAEADAQLRQVEAARLKLAFQVKDAYYEYYYLAQALAVTAENVRLLRELESVARARYVAGTASQPDVIRVQVELGRLQNELATLGDMRGPATAKLNAAMGRPAEAPLPWPKDAPRQDVAVSDAQLLAWLAESNPELKSLEAQVQRSRQSIALAGKDYYPDVMLGFEYDWMFESSMLQQEPKNPYAVMLSLNVPIWWDKYRAEIREAQANLYAAQRDKADKANSLGADVKMAAYRFRDASRRAALYRDTLTPKAGESLRATEAAFRTGTATTLDLIDSQRTLLEFQLAYHRALADRAQRLAELEMLVGRPLPRPAATQPASQPASRPAAAGSDAAAAVAPSAAGPSADNANR